MKKSFFRVLTLLVLILPIYLTLFANKNQIKSAPITSLKDQLSNAQLSFFGRIASYAGSVIKINTAANPSKITANLATGDTVAIANVGVTTSTLYVVKDIGDTATIELAADIGTTAGGALPSYVIATRSAIHTVSFTPQSTAIGQTWQFLIKATDRSATGELPMDGIPDQTGFDLGSTIPGVGTTGSGTRLQVADITCPFGGVATVGTTAVITSGINVGSTGSYHIIQCTGNSSSGVGASFIVGRALNLGSQLINPAPGVNHTVGKADSTSDTFAYAIRQIDGSGNTVDITFGKLAVTESVRVTAIVDPTITFIIDNVGTTNIGASRCNTTLSNGAPSTTATAVSFGPLNLGSFNNLAQRLQCTTNSQNGYVIQAYENRAMTMIGITGAGGGTTIPDTSCEGGTACTPTAQRAWTGYTNSGFGYALEVGTTTGVAANVSIGITTAGHYKPFGVGYANAQSVLSRTDTPGATDSIYVCYRATASTIQQAGTYENQISFIATATF